MWLTPKFDISFGCPFGYLRKHKTITISRPLFPYTLSVISIQYFTCTVKPPTQHNNKGHSTINLLSKDILLCPYNSSNIYYKPHNLSTKDKTNFVEVWLYMNMNTLFDLTINHTVCVNRTCFLIWCCC